MIIKEKTISIDEIRKKVRPILKRAGIISSSVFGSTARGEAKPDSDIDILIDFKRQMTLLDLVGLQQELESALGYHVDLVTRRSLYSPLKSKIEHEEIPIM